MIRDREETRCVENNGKKRVMSLPELSFLTSRHYTVRIGEELISIPYSLIYSYQAKIPAMPAKK